MSNPNFPEEIIKVAVPWFFILLVCATGFSLFADELLRLLVPESYWQASQSIVFLVFGVALHGSTQITVIGISIAERSKLLVWITWLTAIINFGLNFALIPNYGSFGASVATFIAYAILTLIYSTFSQNFLPLPWPKKRLLNMGLIFVLSLLSCFLFTLVSWHPILVPFKILILMLLVLSGLRFEFLKRNMISEVIRWRVPAKNV
jgi:O-antigen/teichoic acid export membrane protein